MARSIVSAVVEHDAGTNPRDVLNRYVGQRLYNGGRSGATIVEVLRGEASEVSATPAEAPAAPEPRTTNEFLAALLAEQRAIHQMLAERLPG